MCPSLVHDIIAFNTGQHHQRSLARQLKTDEWSHAEPDMASSFTINTHAIQLKTSPSSECDFLPNLTYSDAHFQISHSISPTGLCLLHVYSSCLSDAHLIFMRNVSDPIYHQAPPPPHTLFMSCCGQMERKCTQTISEPIRRSHNKTSVIHIVYSDCSCCSE